MLAFLHALAHAAAGHKCCCMLWLVDFVKCGEKKSKKLRRTIIL